MLSHLANELFRLGLALPVAAVRTVARVTPDVNGLDGPLTDYDRGFLDAAGLAWNRSRQC